MPGGADAPARPGRITWTGEFADSAAERAFAEGRAGLTRVLGALVVAATSLCSVGFVPLDVMMLRGDRLALFLADRLAIALICAAALVAVRRAATAARVVRVTTLHQILFFSLNALVFAHPALDRHGAVFFPLIAVCLAIVLPGSFRGAAALTTFAAGISLLFWGVVRPEPAGAVDLAIIGGLTVVALVVGLVVRLNFGRMAREAQQHLDREREIGQRLREAKEAAEAAARAKAGFLAMMSHEIRTPMNGVMGLLRLSLDDAADECMRDRLATALDSATALLTILDDILDFSKLDAGRLDIEERAFDLPRLAGSVCDLMAVRADEKGLSLVREVAPDLPRFVRSDPTRLRQMLSNLLGNAVKFTREGSVRLAVRAAGRQDGRTILKFEVADTGIGIAPEDRAKLFRDFSQVDASVARRFGGTGLGLAITRRLVERMGGRIGVDSEPGRGSTFWFELPVMEAERPEEAAEAEPPPSEGRLRILLAEDNPVNQKVAMAMLSRHHDVALATNGLEAVSMVEGGGFDLVLMDMHIPGPDGLEATRRIRALPGAASRIPIVAMTANTFKSDSERCLEAGMDDFLPKPIDLRRLLATVARHGPSGTAGKAANLLPGAAEPAAAAGLAAEFAAQARQACRVLLEGSDLQASHRAAHDLKGQAATFGLPQVRALAAAIEAACRDGDADRARTLARDLPRHLDGALRRMADMPAEAVAPTAPMAGDGTDGACILVVEDNAHNVATLTALLRRDGHRVVVAGNGASALAQLAERPVDLVLLDVMMPGMSGIEVLARLKGDDASRHIPVIMVSALDDATSVVRCIEAGAEDYLFKPFDPVVLRARIGACRDRARLRDAERLIRANFARELAMAREIQDSMLPHAFPGPAGLDGDGLVLPAREVGGDLFDFIRLDEHRLAVAVGDVTGKGLPAAVFMARVLSLLEVVSSPGLGPGAVLARLNDLLCGRNEQTMLVSLFFGILDSRDGRLVVANGGHDRPLVLPDDGPPRWLDLPRGVVLGARPGIAFAESETVLAHGDALVLYSDGLTEAVDPGGDMFGAHRLEATLEALRLRDSAADMVEGLVDTVRSFEGGTERTDDITCVVVRRT